MFIRGKDKGQILGRTVYCVGCFVVRVADLVFLAPCWIPASRGQVARSFLPSPELLLRHPRSCSWVILRMAAQLVSSSHPKVVDRPLRVAVVVRGGHAMRDHCLSVKLPLF